MQDSVRISGWLKNSFVDYPGTVATVLFLSGCNLRCPYCHNPGIVYDRFEPVDIQVILDYISKRKGILEGAVISGGEPTLQPGLTQLCESLRNEGLKIKLDTNGLNPDRIEGIDPDYLALDIKTSLKRYPQLGNLPPDWEKRLCRSLEIVRSRGERGEVRITAVPGIIEQDDIDTLCVELTGNRVFLQQFNNSVELLDADISQVKPHTPGQLQSWCLQFVKSGIPCQIRGL